MRIVLLAALALHPAMVCAANWQPVANGGSGAVVYVDVDSIKGAATNRTAWERWDYSKDKTKKERDSKVLSVCDCNSRSKGIKSFVSYDPNGRVLDTDSYSDYNIRMFPVAPETVGEILLDFICSWQVQ